MKIVDKNKIKKLMTIKNIKNQTELAKKMGISKNELSRILSPNYDYLKNNIRKLCETLDTDLDDIILSEPNEISESKQNRLMDRYIDVSSIIPNRKYNVLELFAGAGGLALGLENAGFNTVGLNEINKYACKTLKKNRPHWNVIEEDIIEFSKNGVRKYIGNNTEIDILSGGYPCQSFSYAGNRLGLEDTRGTMFYYYAEILKELKPKMFLAENVKGLLTHDEGRTLKTMLDVFEEIGYSVSYEVLNAKNYNVAQKRERIVIIGIKKEYENQGINVVFPKSNDKLLTLKDVLKNVPISEGAKYPDKKKKVLELVPPGGYWRDLPEEIAKVLPWVHIAISNAKSLLTDMYHGIKSEFLQGYLNEFCYQFNRTKIPLDPFDRLLALTTSYKSNFKHITYRKVNIQNCILCG